VFAAADDGLGGSAVDIVAARICAVGGHKRLEYQLSLVMHHSLADGCLHSCG
jgi:hypothetical protein